MNRIILIFLLIFSNFQSFGQNYQNYKTEICSNDTITIDNNTLKIRRPIDSLPTHREIWCSCISDFGIRIEFGFFGAFYDKKTKIWMENSFGPTMGISISFRQLNFGIRPKVTTFSPNNNLIFGGDTLFDYFHVNPIKSDFFVGYSIDFDNLFSIEPFVAFSRNSFHVINESDFNRTFKIPSFNSLKLGFTLNKYFTRKEFQFFTIYFNYAYSFANYSKMNSELGKGYNDFTLGIAHKAFSKVRKAYRVD